MYSFGSDIVKRVCFANSRPAIEASGADELKYADDMTATKEFELNVPHDLMFAQLHRTQTAAHEWGKLNQVIFDNAKEEFAVLHPVFGQGDAFRFLGPWIDPKLTMDVAVRKLLSKAKPKLISLLRLCSYYSKMKCSHNSRRMCCRCSSLPVAPSIMPQVHC